MIGLIVLICLTAGLVAVTNDRKHKLSDCFSYLREPHHKTLNELIHGE